MVKSSSRPNVIPIQILFQSFTSSWDGNAEMVSSPNHTFLLCKYFVHILYLVTDKNLESAEGGEWP